MLSFYGRMVILGLMVLGAAVGVAQGTASSTEPVLQDAVLQQTASQSPVLQSPVLQSGMLQSPKLESSVTRLAGMPASEPALERATAGVGTMPAGPTGLSMPQWMPYGGVHEFQAWGGLSWVSGPIWGYRTQVHYAPIDLRYTYLMVAKRHWTTRYAPELTALAWLDEPIVDQNTNAVSGRRHTFGSGFSPVGFQIDFRPSHRAQPFFATNGGFIYFADRVLSPQGSQFMYTIDFGGGYQIHLEHHRAVTIGYRYQHLSNANISVHNPGTDATTFYLGFSQFHTHGVR